MLRLIGEVHSQTGTLLRQVKLLRSEQGENLQLVFAKHWMNAVDRAWRFAVVLWFRSRNLSYLPLSQSGPRDSICLNVQAELAARACKAWRASCSWLRRRCTGICRAFVLFLCGISLSWYTYSIRLHVEARTSRATLRNAWKEAQWSILGLIVLDSDRGVILIF